MSVAKLTESRDFDRVLEYTRDAVMAGVHDNVFDHSPLLSTFLGRLQNADFGPVRMNGRGKRTQTGGESIRVQHNLGKNTSAKALTGAWDTVTTDPSDTVRHSRTNWKHYSATITLSEFELLVNRGPEMLANLVESETQIAMTSLGDLIGDHLYSNGEVSHRVTELQDLVGTGAIQGLTPSDYEFFFSRGVSARGTASGSVSFASGSFATQGLSDMRKCWNNASEGSKRPMGVYTTYDVFQFYENDLQADQRFTNSAMADGGFEQLAFKSAPVFPDSKCPSGELYMINFDHAKVVVLDGADFTAGPFERAEQQEARVSKIMWKGNLMTDDRRFVNKLTGITA